MYKEIFLQMFWILPFLLEDTVTSLTLQDEMSVCIKANIHLSNSFSWIEIGPYRQKYVQENLSKEKKKSYFVHLDQGA